MQRERIEYIEQSGEYKYSIVNKSNSNYLFLPYGLNYQHKFDEEGHKRTYEHDLTKLVVKGSGEDAETRTDNNDDRNEEKQGDIVSDSAEEGTLTLHLPDVIESHLDIGYQHEDSAKHEEKSDAKEYAFLGVYEIGIDKTDDGIGCIRL